MRVDFDSPAVQGIRASGLKFQVVQTEIPSGPEESAQLQGIALAQLLRTIVVRLGENDYVFVLVPGGRQIDWPKLRALLGTRRISLPDKDEAKQVTGYDRGAITPFGATRAWPVVADAAVAAAGLVAIGAGARGANFHVDARGLLKTLDARVADVTKPG